MISSIIYQKIVGTFPQLDRDVVVALSEEIAQAMPQPLDGKELKKQIKDILRRFGNFMDGYDGDLDEIDIDEALTQILTLLRPKIEKAKRQQCDNCSREDWGFKHMYISKNIETVKED